MKFKKWLYEEGKAMDVSPDMENFAKETIEKLKDKNWNFNDVIHSRIVRSKYGDKNIRIEAVPKKEFTPDGKAYVDMNLIYLYLPSKVNPVYEPISFEEPDGGLPVIKSRGTIGIPDSLPDYESVDYQDCYSTILHEMIHIFDPKLSKNPEWIKKHTQSDQNMQAYYTSPHEQDAWMAHRAHAIVDYYLDYYEGDKNKIQKEFSKPPHLWSPWPADGEPEKTWHQYPKMWRKYLNTLYYVLQKS